MAKDVTNNSSGLNPIKDALALEKSCHCEGKFVENGKLTRCGSFVMVLAYYTAMTQGLRAFLEVLHEPK